MTDRTHAYAEDLTLSQQTSASFSDKLSCPFSAEASTDYWVIWAAMIQPGGSGAAVKAKLVENVTDYASIEDHPLGASDWIPAGGVAKLNPGGSPATMTPKLQYASDGTNNSGIKQATLCVLKADAADEYTESLGESTNTSSTYADKTTLTFTPASLGDYLIIASAEIAQSSNASNYGVGVRLNIDGSYYGEANAFHAINTSNYYPWVQVAKVSLSAASHTLKIQFNTGTFSQGTAKIRNARILAIRLDTLNAEYYGESRARSTTTSSSYQDKATLTQTPAAGDYLILACGVSDTGTYGVAQYDQLLEDAVSIAEGKQTTDHSNALFTKRNFFTMYKKTLAASSKTWKTQYKSNGTNTCALADSSIAVIQLAAPAVALTPMPRDEFGEAITLLTRKDNAPEFMQALALPILGYPPSQIPFVMSLVGGVYVAKSSEEMVGY